MKNWNWIAVIIGFFITLILFGIGIENIYPKLFETLGKVITFLMIFFFSSLLFLGIINSFKNNKKE